MNDDSHFLMSLSAEMSSMGRAYYSDRCREIAAEIERLQSENVDKATAWDKNAEKNAEIKRLTAERDEWKHKWMALAQASLLVGTMYRSTDDGTKPPLSPEPNSLRTT